MCLEAHSSSGLPAPTWRIRSGLCPPRALNRSRPAGRPVEAGRGLARPQPPGMPSPSCPLSSKEGCFLCLFHGGGGRGGRSILQLPGPLHAVLTPLPGPPPSRPDPSAWPQSTPDPSAWASSPATTQGDLCLRSSTGTRGFSSSTPTHTGYIFDSGSPRPRTKLLPRPRLCSIRALGLGPPSGHRNPAGILPSPLTTLPIRKATPHRCPVDERRTKSWLALGTTF